MALNDLQSRLERSDTSEVKILPLAEKVQRLQLLRKKFPGVMLSTTLEPSHSLIDKVVHQYEENCVKLIELTDCTSREQEIRCDKSTPQITFDHSGNIKVTKQSQVTECSIQGDIRLRSAFTRRSLAYELANVASFEVMEGWSQLLFDRVCQDPPAGYKHISVEQIMVADRKLWVKVSEETRSNVTAMTNGRKNVDLAIEKFSHHPMFNSICCRCQSVRAPLQLAATRGSNHTQRQKDHSPARAKVARSLTAKGRLGKERFRFQMDAPSNMGKETTSRSV